LGSATAWGAQFCDACRQQSTPESMLSRAAACPESRTQTVALDTKYKVFIFEHKNACHVLSDPLFFLRSVIFLSRHFQDSSICMKQNLKNDSYTKGKDWHVINLYYTLTATLNLYGIMLQSCVATIKMIKLHVTNK